MKIVIFGIDGYLGWPLALRLAARGHDVIGVDNYSTRRGVEEVGSWSALPIGTMEERLRAAKEVMGVDISFIEGDVTDYGVVKKVMQEKPDAVVHFAEQKSAPYSMMDLDHAKYTFTNNIIGTLNIVYAARDLSPRTHILKMGTLGEYGTPNFDIPETAMVKAIIGDREDEIVVPRWAGSWYHWSKVYDSYNLMYANKLWGLTVTDIHQGPVYGTRTPEIIDERLFTRFDFDDVWGTVINRYCAQAVIGHPLTVYGSGKQIRGFISLEDSIDSIYLLLTHPPEEGEYRVVHQYREAHSVIEIAHIVRNAAAELGMEVSIDHIQNPRAEKEEHYYNPIRRVLPSLGMFGLRKDFRSEVKVMLQDIIPYRHRIEEKRSIIMPRVRWR
ncbi:NAD-dependent dehydratase [Thermocladium modestius]|uniref:NAD-dependent dehydratase n=1 Tax=Thermocladium modestius TaxID=62609 RepID=A0A830GYF2_9CREN|nr:UDP-sulfoquinovose synthase [Thermocladium modestius]GGP22416.1 NAD-dependent dehydratase [Thermocladium modestius]